MKPVYSLCAVALLAGLLVMGASAVTVTVDKHDYKSNETISAHVSGMTNGVNYTLKVSMDQQVGGLPSAFGNGNITVPFNIGSNSFTVTNTNTTLNSVVIGEYETDMEDITTEGPYHEISFNGTSVNGVFTRSYHFDEYEGGTAVTKWIATPIAGATVVTSAFTIAGVKLAGPNDFPLNFSFYTVNPAVVNIEIVADGTSAYKDTFTIAKGAVPTVIPTLTSSGDSDSGSYSGSSVTTATTTTSVTGTLTSGSTTPVGTGGTTTGGATPVGTATAQTTGNATATKTTPASGSPFAFAALGALGCAALLLAGRVRR